MEFKEYLQHLKKTTGVSASKFAEMMDVKKQTISTIAQKKTRPSFKLAKKIVYASFFQVSYKDLLPEVYLEIVEDYKRNKLK